MHMREALIGLGGGSVRKVTDRQNMRMEKWRADLGRVERVWWVNTIKIREMQWGTLSKKQKSKVPEEDIQLPAMAPKHTEIYMAIYTTYTHTQRHINIIHTDRHKNKTHTKSREGLTGKRGKTRRGQHKRKKWGFGGCMLHCTSKKMSDFLKKIFL